MLGDVKLGVEYIGRYIFKGDLCGIFRFNHRFWCKNSLFWGLVVRKSKKAVICIALIIVIINVFYYV